MELHRRRSVRKEDGDGAEGFSARALSMRKPDEASVASLAMLCL